MNKSKQYFKLLGILSISFLIVFAVGRSSLQITPTGQPVDFVALMQKTIAQIQGKSDIASQPISAETQKRWQAEYAEAKKLPLIPVAQGVYAQTSGSTSIVTIDEGKITFKVYSIKLSNGTIVHIKVPEGNNPPSVATLDQIYGVK